MVIYQQHGKSWWKHSPCSSEYPPMFSLKLSRWVSRIWAFRGHPAAYFAIVIYQNSNTFQKSRDKSWGKGQSWCLCWITD